jgi:hypothetical protein
MEFHAHSPLGKYITCAMYDRPSEPGNVLCETYGPGRESTATLDAKGRVGLCATYNLQRNPCPEGNAGEGTPTLGYGTRVTVGRFRCLILRKGVQCTVIATGEGFLFNPAKEIRIGGARPAPSATVARACGTIGGAGQPVPRTVEVYRGQLPCSQARAVARSYLTGRGTFHGPAAGPRSRQYVALPGGWRCSVVEQGGASCKRGGDEVAFVLD